MKINSGSVARAEPSGSVAESRAVKAVSSLAEVKAAIGDFQKMGGKLVFMKESEGVEGVHLSIRENRAEAPGMPKVAEFFVNHRGEPFLVKEDGTLAPATEFKNPYAAKPEPEKKDGWVRGGGRPSIV